jgi:hypothetical protein
MQTITSIAKIQPDAGINIWGEFSHIVCLRTREDDAPEGTEGRIYYFLISNRTDYVAPLSPEGAGEVAIANIFKDFERTYVEKREHKTLDS